VWPGALVASIGYELTKEGFSLYLENFGRYGAVYGSIGAVIALLVFTFLTANLFLFGAETAAEWPRVRDSDLEELEQGPPTPRRLRRALRSLVTHEEK
jgi:membrane protein